jgi:4'-phosphopantetheinyl transferase
VEDTSGTNARAPACGRSWIEARGRPLLDPGRVHVWRVDLDEPGWGTEAMTALLGAEERERAASLALARHRRQFAAGRSALRTILSGYADTDSPASLAFAADMSGKPFLAGPDGASGLSFNMSHSGGIALVAAARGAAVGVDVERLRPGARFAEIARRQFSPEVTRALLALEPSRQPAAFLRCWCALEARLKALGTGFSAGAEVMAQMSLPDTLLASLDAEEWSGIAGPWLVTSLDAGEGYGAAVAVDAAAVHTPGDWLKTFQAHAPA